MAHLAPRGRGHTPENCIGETHAAYTQRREEHFQAGGGKSSLPTKLWQGFMKYALKMSSYLPFCSSNVLKNSLKADGFKSESPKRRQTNLGFALKTFAVPTKDWNRKTLYVVCRWVVSRVSAVVCRMCMCHCVGLFVSQCAGCLLFVPFVCIQILQTTSGDAATFVCRGPGPRWNQRLGSLHIGNTGNCQPGKEWSPGPSLLAFHSFSVSDSQSPQWELRVHIKIAYKSAPHLFLLHIFLAECHP